MFLLVAGFRVSCVGCFFASGLLGSIYPTGEVGESMIRTWLWASL